MLRVHNNPFLIQALKDQISSISSEETPSPSWYYSWWVIATVICSMILIIVIAIYLIGRYRQRNRISKRDLLLQGHDRGTILKQSFSVSSYAPPKYLPIENTMQEKFYPTLQT